MATKWPCILFILSLCFTGNMEILAKKFKLPEFKSPAERFKTINEKHEVHIVNELGDNYVPLTLHCYSGDDDLGYHDLRANEHYYFRFGPNFFTYHTTKFYCHFWWRDMERSFAVYDRRIMNYHCDNSIVMCWWVVKEDGFYIGNYANPQPQDLEKLDWWMPVSPPSPPQTALSNNVSLPSVAKQHELKT